MGRKLHDVRCGSRAVGSGWLSFKLGRKKSLMIAQSCLLPVHCSLRLRQTLKYDSFPRSAGAGGGCGLLYRTTYLSEIAPEKIRGSMISMYQ